MGAVSSQRWGRLRFCTCIDYLHQKSRPNQRLTNGVVCLIRCISMDLKGLWKSSTTPILTFCGGADVMIIGAPSTPRFVATTDPSTSETETTIVRLYASGARPGGILVLRVGDIDQEAESWFSSVDSLLFRRQRASNGGRGGLDASSGAHNSQNASISLRYANRLVWGAIIDT